MLNRAKASFLLFCLRRSSCCTWPKKTKTNQKNSEKHLENPPEMHASQRRHTSSDGGLYSRASTRTTPSNGPPQ